MKLRPFRRVDETGAEKRTRRSKQQMDEFDPLTKSSVYSQPKGTGIWLGLVIILGVMTVIASLIGVSRSGAVVEATADIAADNNRLLKEAQEREQRVNLMVAAAREHDDRVHGCILHLYERATGSTVEVEVVGSPCDGLILGETTVSPSTIPVTTTTATTRPRATPTTRRATPTTRATASAPAVRPAPPTTCATNPSGRCKKEKDKK